MRVAWVVALLIVSSGRVWAKDLMEVQSEAMVAAHDGDAWNVAVPALVKVLGEPATATPDAIEWAVPGDQACLHVTVKREEGFVGSLIPALYRVPSADPTECLNLSKKHAKVPKLVAPPKVDLATPTKAILGQWRDRKFKAIFDAAHPEFRELMKSPDALERIANTTAGLAGKFVKIGGPMQEAVGDYSWLVIVPVVYEKGTLRARVQLRLVDKKLRLYGFHLDVPDELTHYDRKDAEKLGEHVLDLLLANDTKQLVALADADLKSKLPEAEEFRKQLATVLQKMGTVKKKFMSDQHDCGESRPGDRECLTYEIESDRGKGAATVELDFNYDTSRWELSALNISAPK